MFNSSRNNCIIIGYFKMNFQIKSDYKKTADQANAIDKLSSGLLNNIKEQVLLGVTGSGKTFTMANIIEKTQLPTLIISHNKTLAGQLYQEMKEFFPDNGVSYFVSYYDYYQPEAYIPSTDTYIEKEAQINQLIDKLRLRSMTNMLTRKDVIVVASVSCIYNIGSPKDFKKFLVEISAKDFIDRNKLFSDLVGLQYERNEFSFKRGTFRVRGNNIDIYPAYEDFAYRLFIVDEFVDKIAVIDPMTGKINGNLLDKILIYPAKQFMADKTSLIENEPRIREDLRLESEALKKSGKEFEAHRLLKKVNYDLEMIRELGYVNGIENYSRYFDGRSPGDPPYSLLNYFQEQFGDNWMTIVDESHMTIPQLRGMYNGDNSRKQTLVDYGFRLKSAFDNRPLRFEEFHKQIKKAVYVSATPDEWEINQAKGHIAEQLVRPTGIVDPKITIKKGENEIPDLIMEIEKRVAKKERVLVTTLTKRIAEDLSNYLKEKNIKAEYLHSDIKTLERSEILNKLRKQEYDVLIGINLLREGLDLPEVTLVAILDADKEGFLRSRTALIQTMGRAARNIEGEVIIYANNITKSIKLAVEEVDRRREYQIEYNKRHNINPTNIYKKIRENIMDGEFVDEEETLKNQTKKYLEDLSTDDLTPYDKKKVIKKLELEMKRQAEELNFELAIEIRNKIRHLTSS